MNFKTRVYCNSEYGSYPNRAVITFDKTEAEKVLELSKKVKELGVGGMFIYGFGTCDFSEPGVEEPDWRTVDEKLYILDDVFYYKANIKHTNETVETKFLAISTLRKKLKCCTE